MEELPWKRWIIWKINKLLSLTGIQKNYRYRLNKKRFQKALTTYAIESLNSQMSYSDAVILDSDIPAHCKLSFTLHGEYELAMSDVTQKESLSKQTKDILHKSKTIIYTADKNLIPFEPIPSTFRGKFEKIPVGFSASLFKIIQVSREQLGFRKDDFVVGMVSRGIEEKGWNTAIAVIQAYNSRHQTNVKLLLIGDGNYLQNLVESAKDENIRLLQFNENFQDYFSYYQLMDLFLFPTRFEGESFPNVVIESLYWQVPVLSVLKAEIPTMIGIGSGHPAGVCIEPTKDVVTKITDEIETLIRDVDRLKQYRANCAVVFRTFDMDSVANKYLTLLA